MFACLSVKVLILQIYVTPSKINNPRILSSYTCMVIVQNSIFAIEVYLTAIC